MTTTETLTWPADGPLDVPMQVTISGLDRPTWDALIDEHPPPRGGGHRSDDDTFWAALICACTGMTAGPATDLADDTEIGGGPGGQDRKSTRLNSSHSLTSRMPSST